MSAELAIAPERVTFVNLATGEECVAPRNPEEPEWEVGANFDKKKVLGMSHEPQQFVTTNNLAFDFEMTTLVETRLELLELEKFRKFILSLTVPRASGADEGTGGLPRVLVVWPNYCSVTCFVVSASEKTKRQNRNSSPVETVFKLKLEEVRDQRMTSEQVRQNGLFRATLPGSLVDND